MKNIIGMAMLLPLLALTAACSDDTGGTGTDAQATPRQDGGSTPGTDGIAATLAQDLAFLREEEKLARDVYLTLHQKWGLNIFKNIASSEQTHTDQVKALIKTKGFSDPVKDDTVGVFADATLLKLYGDLVKAGGASEVAALQVGTEIEDLDIHDIAKMSSRTSDAAALKLYSALSCGSQNHMRSFYAQLKAKGASYTAKYISAAELTSILASSGSGCGQP